MDTPTNPGSTPASPAPAGKPAAPAAPSAPQLDLSHESPAVAAAMKHPGYFDAKHPQHTQAVEAAFAARQLGNTPARTDLVEGFPQTSDMVPADAATGNVGATAFPVEMSPVVQQSFRGIAADAGLGSRELAAIAKEAVPFLNDNERYTFESGEKALQAQLGDKAASTLQAAKNFVDEFPEVYRALKVRGLANHPGVVRVLAARWNARDGLQKKAGAARSNPQFFGPKSGQGNVNHAEAKQLADDVAALMEELHS